MKLLLTLSLTAILALVAMTHTPGALVDTERGRRTMADMDVPAHATSYLLLVASTVAPEVPPDVDGKTLVLAWYNPDTNRIQLLESSSEYREIPTFTTKFAPIAGLSMVVVNADGNFDTTFSETMANPAVLFIGQVLPVAWPDMGNTPGGGTSPRIGDAMVITSIADETARDGTTATKRGRLNVRQVEQCVVERSRPNMNNASAQFIWENDTGRTFVVTRVVWRESANDLSGSGAQTITIGTNSSTYNNVADPFKLADLDSADSVVVVTPKSGAKVVKNAEQLWFKPTGALFGSSSLISVDLWGYFVG